MSVNKSALQDAGKALEVSDEISILTLGASMQPMLRQHKDVVTVKRVDRELKKGDVVLYPGMGGKFILHRIVAIKKGELIIRGDNNAFTEYGIKREDIVGILKEFYRNGMYINCDTSFKYKAYSFYILHSYAIRYFWKRILRPFLSKVKRFVLRRNK